MKNKKGFTLVELLIVIAIIGILASIVLVNLTSARQRANAASVFAILESLNKSMVQCVSSGGTLGAMTIAQLNASPRTTNNDICSTVPGVKYPDIKTKYNWNYAGGMDTTQTAASPGIGFGANKGTYRIACGDNKGDMSGWWSLGWSLAGKTACLKSGF